MIDRWRCIWNRCAVACWRASSTCLSAPFKLGTSRGFAIWFRILGLNVFEVVEERGSILSTSILQDVSSLSMATAESIGCRLLVQFF